MAAAWQSGVMAIDAEPLELLRTRTSEKWTEYPDDVLPLFVAEMDYPLAEPIAEALRAAIARSDTGYIGRDDHAKSAFAAFARASWGWDAEPSRMITTTDVSVVVVEALRLAISPGERVIITPPVYPPFFEFVPEAGGIVEEVPLLSGTDGWSLDLEGIERAFASGARAFLLCNPHNPLGLVHTREQLAAVARLAARYDAVVISDEVHAPLTQPDAVFTPFLTVSDDARRHGIAAHSASKTWNLAGLKCALFVTGHDRMTERIRSLPVEVEVRTSHFGRIATEAAYRDGEPWRRDVLAALRSNRELLAALLGRHLPDARFREPDASYLGWIDLSAYGWGDDPSERILESAKVALNPGPDFGTEGAGYVRLNFACAPAVLEDAVTRMGRIPRG
jgi:cystathionine beta-lyase